MTVDVLKKRVDELKEAYDKCEHKRIKTMISNTLRLNKDLYKDAKVNARNGFDTVVRATNLRYLVGDLDD